MALFKVEMAVVIAADDADHAALLADDAAQAWEAWPHVRDIAFGTRVPDDIRPLTPEEAADYPNAE